MTTTIENIQSIVNSSTTTSESSNKDLGQDDFLELLTTQLSNQDPFEPMDNGEFITQMAQFSTVSGIQDLQESFTDFAATMSQNQLVQIAPLVGNSVAVNSSAGYFDGEVMNGTIQLDSYASDVSLKIYSTNGVLVDELSLGPQYAGDLEFEWDGKDSSGDVMSEGAYVIQASAISDGKVVSLNTSVVAEVESVSLNNGSGSPTLNLKGIGEVSLNSVEQIRQ